MAQVMLLRCEMLVWVDESGCGKKDAIHKYGYSLCGMCAEYHQFITRDTRFNTTATMSLQEWWLHR